MNYIVECVFILGLFIHFYAWAEVSSKHLSEQTLERFDRVPEFEFIIQEAYKLGVKVYLFGGTASAFAHYVRWDLEREAGDDKYQKERFDYDFTNIYRGNQDLDIVVDGTPEQADQLKSILQKQYPHFVGSKVAWEVRLLKESRGDKRALLGDEDFRRQHSDTNSTGMLLLNPDPQGIVYNDLLNWGSAESDFLNDVAAARIKFLFADEHEKTQRYKDGLNPPVLAAIRYLAKLAQYEVQGTTEDLKTVTQIIEETDFTKLSDYGKKKAEEFALKTLLNAPDSEYAWNLLDKTGARSKLIEMDGAKISVAESLSWWMNKEPLRSKQLGTEGKTAREIFDENEIIVSHETNSFKAYDNITRSSKGGANAFISRQGVVGEMAAYGEGFYTKRGLKGARGTGLTIRFFLHPDSREGVDFERENEYVIVKNKKALTLIQENLNLSMIGFLELIKKGDIKRQDRGLLEKFNRKFNRQRGDSKEFEEAVKYVKKQIRLTFDFNFIDVDLLKFNNFSELAEFYSVLNVGNMTSTIAQLAKKIDFKFDWVEKIIERADYSILEALVQNALDKFKHDEQSYFIEKILDQAELLFKNREIYQTQFLEFEKRDGVFKRSSVFIAVKSLLSEKIVEKMFQTNSCDVLVFFAQTNLIHPDFAESREEIFTRILSKCSSANSAAKILKSVADHDEIKLSREFMVMIIKIFAKELTFLEELQKESDLENLIFRIFEKKNEKGMSELISHLVEHVFPHKVVWSDLKLLEKIAEGLLSYGGSFGVSLRTMLVQKTLDQPELVEWLLKTKMLNRYYKSGLQAGDLIRNILNKPYWKDGELMSIMLQHHIAGEDMSIKGHLMSAKWWIYPDLFTMHIATKTKREGRASGSREANLNFTKKRLVKILSHKNWKKWNRVLEEVLTFPEYHIFNQWDIDKILLDHYWSESYDLMKIYVHHYNDTENLQPVLARKEWAGEIDFLKIFIFRHGLVPDWEGVKEILSQPHWFNHPNYQDWMSNIDKDQHLKDYHQVGLKQVFEQINQGRVCAKIL